MTGQYLACHDAFAHDDEPSFELNSGELSDDAHRLRWVFGGRDDDTTVEVMLDDEPLAAMPP